MDDFDFLTVFAAPEGPWGEQATWCVRTYGSLAELVPLVIPQYAKFDIKAFQMRPQIVEVDYPSFDDDVKIPDDLADSYIDDFANCGGFKLGGWPTLLQGEIFWAPKNGHPAKPEFVFQIDSTVKGNWAWGHGGVGYFGRGTAEGLENDWIFSWACL